ncbi:hypothetical protein PCK2_000072 [Pneumocystis canis]|nr:hypothetical protein PCK2_000072 [Pneumocystis canis]
MLRIKFFLSGTLLSASITYILLLQLRSTTHMISKSLKHLSHQLKNQDDNSKLLWIPAMQSAVNLMSLKNDWKVSGTDGENLNLSVSKCYQDNTSISSDTSESLRGRLKEESLIATACKWNGCFEDQGNLSNLIHHLYHVHIGNIGSIYMCQWDSCSRKGMAYMSRFAFVMHLRSHTGGKSFSCRVPECNKSFLRSDNLIKHMGVVHDLNFLHSSTLGSFIQDSYLETQFTINKDIEDPYIKDKDKNFDNKKLSESDQNDLSDWSEDEVGIYVG